MWIPGQTSLALLITAIGALLVQAAQLGLHVRVILQANDDFGFVTDRAADMPAEIANDVRWILFAGLYLGRFFWVAYGPLMRDDGKRLLGCQGRVALIIGVLTAAYLLGSFAEVASRDYLTTSVCASKEEQFPGVPCLYEP